MKLPSPHIKISLAVTLALFGCMSSLNQLQAKPSVKSAQGDYSFSADSVASPDVQPPPPDDSAPLSFIQLEVAKKGAPGRRRGGGSFGGGNQCQSVNLPLTALVPGIEETLSGEREGTSAAIASLGVRGLTVEGYPSFWFYVPYSSTLSVEFILINDQNKRVHQENYLLTGTPGIVRIRPSSKSMSAPLEVGKDYRWVFSILCDPNDRSADMYVDGWVQRVAPSSNLTTALKIAIPEKRAVLYAKEGLWYETLTTLVEELGPTQPKKATLLMTTLLQSVGLDDIAQQPIVKCCTPNK